MAELDCINIAIEDASSPVQLKPKQAKCVSEVLKGYDVMGKLPTGYGKSP